MTSRPLLDPDQLNEGLNRLLPTEQEEIGHIIANVENQHRFRKRIKEVGHHRVLYLLNKAFPNQSVAIQDFRRSLGHKLIEEQGIDAARRIMHDSESRVIRLGEPDDSRKNYESDS